jgi:hypothetical protein
MPNQIYNVHAHFPAGQTPRTQFWYGLKVSRHARSHNVPRIPPLAGTEPALLFNSLTHRHFGTPDCGMQIAHDLFLTRTVCRAREERV